MTNDEIKDIIKIFSESGMAEIEVKRGENSIRIRRSMAHAATEIVMPQIVTQAAPVSAAAAHVPALQAVAPPNTPPAVLAGSAPAAAPDNDLIVKSPIVGTYYDAPKPGDSPFVRVGDAVESGQVLCIIESMKLMNEIESEVTGTVVAKLVENGRPVEYGEALFTIRPR